MTQKETHVQAGEASYPLSSLSDEARAQVQNLQYIDTEIARLNAQLVVFSTARRVYQDKLRELLPKAA